MFGARINSTLASNAKAQATEEGISQRKLLEKALTMYLRSTAESGPSLPQRVSALERAVSEMSEHIDVLGNALMRMDKSQGVQKKKGFG